MKKLFKNVYYLFFDDDFFQNRKFLQNLELSKDNLRKIDALQIIEQIFKESMQGDLKFEETATRFQKMLRKCNLPKNISKVATLESHSWEYSNKEIRKKIKELSTEIPFFRPIRGDGNCFYRAVGLAFLEQIYLKFWYYIHKGEKNTELLDLLQVLLSKKVPLLICKISETSNANSYRILKEFFNNQNILLYVFLRECCKLMMIVATAESFTEVLKSLAKAIKKNHLFDISLVVTMRSLLYFTLQSNLNQESYSPFLASPEEFLEKLAIFGEEAENILIPISSDALGRIILIHMLHKNHYTGSPEILTEKYGPLLVKPGEILKKYEVISLYFRPGHYDLGYEKENPLLKLLTN